LFSRGRFAEGRGWKEEVVDGREGLVKERRDRGEERGNEGAGTREGGITSRLLGEKA